VLFEPGNARSLEAAVRRAITDDGPERLASAKAHAEHWSMSHLMDEYETLYDEARRRFGVPR
jgi:hypothetical protein